jgi:hypothetical protein
VAAADTAAGDMPAADAPVADATDAGPTIKVYSQCAAAAATAAKASSKKNSGSEVGSHRASDALQAAAARVRDATLSISVAAAVDKAAKMYLSKGPGGVAALAAGAAAARGGLDRLL